MLAPNETARNAISLATSLGWPLVPVQSYLDHQDRPAKRPRINGWKSYATRNPKLLTTWFGRWPDAMIGAVLKPRDGIVIFDIDIKNGHQGFATLERLIERAGPLPRTVSAATATSGGHVFTKLPGDVTLASNSLGGLGDGLDLVVDGLIILPPSFNCVGGQYRWLISPDEAPIATLPEAWVDLLPGLVRKQAPKPGLSRFMKYAAAGLSREVANVEAAQKSTRNGTLNKAAYAMGWFVTQGHLTDAEVREALLTACQRNGYLSEEGPVRVNAVITSAFDAGKDYPRDLGPVISFEQGEPKPVKAPPAHGIGHNQPPSGRDGADASHKILLPLNHDQRAHTLLRAWARVEAGLDPRAGLARRVGWKVVTAMVEFGNAWCSLSNGTIAAHCRSTPDKVREALRVLEEARLVDTYQHPSLGRVVVLRVDADDLPPE